jgi:uncharacterized protein
MRKIFIYGFLLLGIYSLPAQELPRSVMFGAWVVDVPDSIRSELKIKITGGTFVKMVVSNSSASKAGFLPGDILWEMDGRKIENTTHFLQMLKMESGGNRVRFSYFRKNNLRKMSCKLLPKPLESNPNYEIFYSSLKTSENHLRTLITKPKGKGAFPAVLIVGGVGCYSVENPGASGLLATKMWIDSLTARGFVTLRVEKTGMGVSRGIPCDQCDFKTELEGYKQGLKQLKGLPYVDPNQVFIAGFSMGGVIGQLLALESPVKGIVVYGTVGRNWFEYELENTHRQRRLENLSPDSLDVWMRAEYKRLFGLFVEKLPPDAVKEKYPETIPVFFKYPMGISYFQQVADINVRELWMNTQTHVLALHGSSDYVSSEQEHALIAQIVNEENPGKAIFKSIPLSDHWEYKARDEKESKSKKVNEVNPAAMQVAIKWMEGLLSPH